MKGISPAGISAVVGLVAASALVPGCLFRANLDGHIYNDTTTMQHVNLAVNHTGSGGARTLYTKHVSLAPGRYQDLGDTGRSAPGPGSLKIHAELANGTKADWVDSGWTPGEGPNAFWIHLYPSKMEIAAGFED